MRHLSLERIGRTMGRIFSRRAVTTLGLALLAGGLAAMAEGWGVIQVERGWSMFLAGATALAGGAVVIALGQVLARLDALTAAMQMLNSDASGEASRPLAEDDRRTQPGTPAPPAGAHESWEDPAAEQFYPASQPRPEASFVLPPGSEAPRKAPPLRKSYFAFKTEAPRAPEPVVDTVRKETASPPSDAPERALREPKEIDRYQSGGVTYVMFSNGEVEVRTLEGAQRYPSLEELRARATQGH
jgi:hypothetical protein